MNLLGCQTKNRVAKRGLFLALLLALPAGASAQQQRATLSGQVVERDGTTPIPDAAVVLEGIGFRLLTDSTGHFRMSGITPGEDTVAVTYFGIGLDRKPVDLRAGDTTHVTLTAQRTLYEVADLTVTVDRDRRTIIPEFERRRRSGFGHYITPAEIRERDAVDVADYLWSVPGVSREYGTFGDRVTMRSPFGRGDCRPAIFWNGNPMPGMRLADFTPEEVLAIEVYTRPAQMPIRFNSSFNDCGAIVVWTE